MPTMAIGMHALLHLAMPVDSLAELNGRLRARFLRAPGCEARLPDRSTLPLSHRFSGCTRRM